MSFPRHAAPRRTMARGPAARRAASRLGTCLLIAAAAVGAAGLPASASPARPARPPAHAGPAGHAGHAYRRGVIRLLSRRARSQTGTGQATSGARALLDPVLRYGGGTGGIGVTTGHPKVFIVFWGSQWGSQAERNGNLTLAGDPSGVAPYLQELFRGLGTGGELWSGVVTQFCQGIPAGATSCPARNHQHVGYPSGGALAGVWADEASQAPADALGHQLAAEAVRAAAHFGNTSASKNRNSQYLIVSPSGTHPDGFNTSSGNFCGWHDWTGDKTLPGGPVSSPYGHIAFANLPYVPDAGRSCGQDFVNSGAGGQLDGVSLVAGHEYAETLTDQNPPGGWADSAGDETADLCQWNAGPGARSADLTLPTGTFAMQPLFIPGTGGGTCEFRHALVAGGGGGGKPRAHRVRVTSPRRRHTTRGTAVRLRIRARDSARGATLRFRASGLPAGLRIGAASGVITGRPTRDGVFRVRVRVRDRSGAAGSARFTWTVTEPAATVLEGLLGRQAAASQWIIWAGAQAADLQTAPWYRP